MRWFVAVTVSAVVVGCAADDAERSDVSAPPTTELCDTPPPVATPISPESGDTDAGGTESGGTDSADPESSATPAITPASDPTIVTQATAPLDSTLADLEVVVVGDSITEENLVQIDGVLAEGGVGDVRYAALGARRIAETYEYLGLRTSGLEAIEACQADGLDPDVWLIELGTNDVPHIAAEPDPGAAAGELIDGVRTELTGAPAILWVNVLYGPDPDASRAFNDALDVRAAEDPTFQVIDWYGAASGRSDWFADPVHPNRVGAFELARLYLDGIVGLVTVAP
jgi:lysophospholipase L1-like esterase